MASVSDERSLGRILFETREADRLNRYGFATKWEEQIKEVHASWETVAAEFAAELKRRGT